METESFLFGSETISFTIEVIIRSCIAFLIVLLALKLTGKRGVRQLTLFELVIILTLGSAAGDICFYKDVGLIPVIVCIVTIVVLYRIVTFLVLKSDWFEHLIEGTPVMIIDHGRFTDKVSANENISYDEFFMELRLKGIHQLGQVKYAFLEVNGDVSVFKLDKDKATPGLSILPHHVSQKFDTHIGEAYYSCIHCGYTEKMDLSNGKSCPECRRQKWSFGSDDR